ncbi:mycothiol synthase [Acidothermaceae bacterium B102]|nr:mycothiol synthase [Acidothermaceae bacterium B102]
MSVAASAEPHVGVNRFTASLRRVTVAEIEDRARLSGDELAAVLDLVHEVTEADGVLPLSEHVMLHLRYGGDDRVRNLLLRAPDGVLAGYAHLDVTDAVEGSSAEVAVRPAYRRRGYGRQLVEGLLASSPDGRLRLWAHGQHPAAEALAMGMGFERSRVLWQLRRSLHAPLGRAELPDGVTVRAFRPGEDEAEIIALNARAFAAYPDQGRWTLADLEQRERESWFDPAGFFLAEFEGRIVGFHWTKVHGKDQVAPSPDSHGHEPIGEVYVLGIDPGYQGHGLGAALTLIGLRHLRSRGLAQVMLYVDESNPRAISLYERLGFTRWDVDVSFRMH